MPNAFHELENPPRQAEATLPYAGNCLLRSLFVATICFAPWLIQPDYAILPAFICLFLTLVIAHTVGRPLYQIQFGMAAIAYSLVTAGNAWLLPDHATWLQTPFVRIATVAAGIVALLIFFRLDFEPRLWRLYLKDRVIVTPGTYRHPTFVALAYFLIDRGGMLVAMAGLYGHFTNYINEGTREAAWPYLFAIIGGLCGPLLIAPLIRSHFMVPASTTPKGPNIPYLGPSSFTDGEDED